MFTHENLVGYLKASTATADDKTALLGAELYKFWDDIPDGAEIKEGERVRHPKTDPILWKCNPGQTHNKQTNWAPSIHTASLWTAISDDTHTETDELGTVYSHSFALDGYFG